ncbi:uncharacterized protein PV09_00172 [Verruconis gallopava]|uniref:Mid2 domain-containing protein n=1 Tax=Verruconis gallopava TaxID=253628 RepID=A0A0D2ARA8_9PEZI|nr:uncharacterized protein PV09_00172 [Verruconis gallopava]KIW09248.1 hypothetical protein PV09_00172 [Verruconis gallopava]
MYQPFSLVICSCFVLISRAQTCYWPNGSQLTAKDNYTACSSDAVSQCCAIGHACLSNGLCFNPTKGSVYRRGCTDSKWSSSACPQYCNTMSDFKQSSVTLAPCPPDANGQWNWWCGQDYTNVCGSSNQNTSIFNYPANAYILKVAGSENQTTTAISGSATSGTNAATPLDQPASCANGSDKDKVSKMTPIAVGIGVGVPLAMLATTMGFFFWKERKRRIIAERLGYAGQVINLAKQSYDKDGVPSVPVFELSPDTAKVQLHGSESRS